MSTKQLTKYVKDGQSQKAMQLFQQMQQEGVRSNKFTFVPVIKACAGLGTLEDSRLVHKQLIQSGCESDVKCGQGQKALELFQQMQQEGMQPDSVTFVGC
jgi:pentatricopeptide repeat protein